MKIVHVCVGRPHAVAEEIAAIAGPGRALAVETDITDVESCANRLRMAFDAFGALHVLELTLAAEFCLIYSQSTTRRSPDGKPWEGWRIYGLQSLRSCKSHAI